MVSAGESDLYVIPVYKTAFLNPFDTTSLDFICRFVTGDGELAEQVEIEFLPDLVEDAADVVVLGKWLCQSVANRHGLISTFSPKIQIGDAGSGLHFHAMLKKNNRNIMLNADQELSEDALKLIGGLCRYASTLSAFGNMTAASFLRLVPHQEAPTTVCWGYSNRSALIRVPLGWRNLDNLAMMVNPQQKLKSEIKDSRQTAE